MTNISFVLNPLAEMHFATKEDLNVFNINEDSLNVLFKSLDEQSTTLSWFHIGKNGINFLVNYDEDIDIRLISKSECIDIVESLKKDSVLLICPVDEDGIFNTNDLSGEMRDKIIDSIKQLYI